MIFLNEFPSSDYVGGSHLRKLLGRYLSRLRTERGWSVADVAKMAGLTLVQIQKIESGQSKISADCWEILCEIFDFCQADIENLVKVSTVFRIIEIDEALCEHE